MSKILIINYSDTNSEMEKVKNLLSFEGNVKIIEGTKDFDLLQCARNIVWPSFRLR